MELSLKKVNEQKHLGLILDSALSFKKHLDVKNHYSQKKHRDNQASFKFSTSGDPRANV